MHAQRTKRLVICASLATAIVGVQPILANAAKASKSAPRLERVVAAVGDLVCEPGTATTVNSCRHQQVSNLLVADKTVKSLLLLGDLQYDTGSVDGFTGPYDQSYGRLNSIAIPTPGNHEYGTANAAGYFQYFGSRAHPQSNGYYSINLSKSWHLAVINSNCDAIGGCDVGSAQMNWLLTDLAANKRPCVAAIWHHPLFTSAERGPNQFMKPIWDALDAAQADLVLVGHEHQYERFDPQNSSGAAAANSPRQFVIGTGGKSVYALGKQTANSKVNGTGFGFLRLELKSTGYNWKFVNDPDVAPIQDAGRADCH